MKTRYQAGDLVVVKAVEGGDRPGHYVEGIVVSETGDRPPEYIVVASVPSGRVSDTFVHVASENLFQGTLEKPLIFAVDRTMTVDAGRLETLHMARLGRDKLREILKKWAMVPTRAYYAAIHQQDQQAPFISGKSWINYGGRTFDAREMVNLVDSALDFWLTAGEYAKNFEANLAKFLGVSYSFLVNSGSSANLIAFMALTSPKLADKRIRRGDEVITVAAGFPTTVAPMIQYGVIPVFVDVSLPTYNINCDLLEEALSERTRAVMVAHTLGNPFDLKRVKEFCDRHDLWLVEDNCDALGSRYLLDGAWHYTGTVGHIGTSSFYPPHHMTMGEGGAVYTNDPILARVVESLRDWGRDCRCPSGQDDTCGRRFSQQFGELPFGYDHKYVYAHFGYNLKVTDMQAAIGVAQLAKLPEFTTARQRHWRILREGLADLADRFILPEPTVNADPSWFGFLLTVRSETGMDRQQVVSHLEANGIQTRMLFAGNLIRHPCFDELRKSGEGFRVVNNLEITDRIMKETFWLGVYPGMKAGSVQYMVDIMKKLSL